MMGLSWRILLGILLAALPAWIGIDALLTKETSFWFGVLRRAGLGGLTLRGDLALIMGLGWLCLAVALFGFAAFPKGTRESRKGYWLSGGGFLIFALCFLWVVIVSVATMFFPSGL
jgi:hypothetical protein